MIMSVRPSFSITSMLIAALLVFCLAIMICVNLIVNKWTKEVFLRLQQDDLLRQSQVLVNNIETSTENCRLALQDYAAFPVITHGVMQPEFALANIADFMDGLSVLGYKCQLVLLNFRGQVIHASMNAPKFDYSKEKWMSEIISGRQRHYAGISSYDGNFYFRIAVPVSYNRHIEGLLVAELPVSHWSSQFRKSSMLDNAYIELLCHDKTFAVFGRKSAAPIQKLELGHLDLSMLYQGNFTQLENNREILIINLSSALIVTFGVITGLGFLLAHFGFIKSLLKLRDSISSLAVNRFRGNIDAAQRITEIRELASAFNQMAVKIINREQALLAAKDGLERQVSERTAELRYELEEKQKTEAELKRIQEELEERVHRRTLELEQINQELKDALHELSNTQGMLLQNEKMASIGQLAAGIAHEINNPAGYVASNLATLAEYVRDFETLLDHYAKLVETLMSRGLLPEDQQRLIAEAEAKIDISGIRADIGDLLKDARDGMKRIAKIISDLKDFSHVNKDEVEDYDLNKVIDQTINIAWHELKYKVEIVREFGDIPIISGYPGQIGQVIMNMLVNAAQAIPRQGRITIRTWHENDRVLCSIADTGTGIPENIIQKIYDPFFTTKPVGKGTGLGLNIAYNIIKAHNGDIAVDSKIGEGTVFTISLPLVFVPADAGAENVA